MALPPSRGSRALEPSIVPDKRCCSELFTQRLRQARCTLFQCITPGAERQTRRVALLLRLFFRTRASTVPHLSLSSRPLGGVVLLCLLCVWVVRLGKAKLVEAWEAMSSGAPAPYDEENNVEASLLQRGSLSLENGGAEPKGRARPPVTQPHWVAFIRSYPTPLFNSLTAVFALLAFVFFVATVSLSQRTQLVLHAAKQPLGCPVAPCGAAPAPAGGRQAITVPTAAVAADEPRCSAVGNATLSAGGTAVDAAVSTALCLGVLHPHSSGVGGGCFILIYTAATGDAEVIDARETAPAAATENMYSGNPSASVIGGLAVAVPGELRGLYLAWQRHGALPWSDLVRAPSLKPENSSFSNT